LLLSLASSLIIGFIVLLILRKFKFWQPIKDYGPKSHYLKQGTPTMGGIAISLSFFLNLVLLYNHLSKQLAFIALASLLSSLIGLIDDIAKVRVGTKGMGTKGKLIAQVGVSLLIIFFLKRMSLYDSRLWVPFLRGFSLHDILYLSFVAFIFVACMNAVNITDGLDGLACGSSILASFSLFLIALWQGNEEVGRALIIMIGVLLGFLYYNRYPAKMFMGDSGAMFLGGFMAAVSLILKVEILIPFICGIFLIDTLSVIIQLSSYRLRGKRVFLMSPLHHHFELKGWKETNVVALFWLIEGILSLFGVILYKIG